MPPSELYRHPGIVKDENLCVNRTDWQAWFCRGLEYKMLVIESMDRDTEDRRLSPVAIISDNGYIDLINGPQDHGWCFGFTCQKRISTFTALVAANKSYDIYLTSTPPNQLRFRILNADASFKVRLSMHYFSSNRIDLYVNNSFVAPTNAYYQNGNMFLRDPATNINMFKPTYSSAPGSNVFIKSDSKIYFAMSGSEFIDLKIGPVLFLRFGMPAITPDQFFDPANVVSNFAALLNIDPKLIRSVQIVRASSRKRDTGLIYVALFIYEDAVPLATDSPLYESVIQNLAAIDANTTNRFTIGQLAEDAMNLFNVTVESLSVQRVDQPDAGLVDINKIQEVQVLIQPSGCREQSPCAVQPKVVALDQNVHFNL